MAITERVLKTRYEFRAHVYCNDSDPLKEFDIPRIHSIEKNVDFLAQFAPMFTFNVSIDQNQASIISLNEKKMLIDIECIRYLYENRAGDALRVEVESKIVFSKTFIPSFEKDDISNFRTIPSYDNSDGSKAFGDIDDSKNNINFYDLRIYLESYDYKQAYKKNYNGVIRTGIEGWGRIELSNALYFICESTWCNSYIIDIPDNNVGYENIIIPPGNLKEVLAKMQVDYGIYGGGLSMFYDLDSYLYITNILTLAHEVEDGMPFRCDIKVFTDKESADSDNNTYEEGGSVAHSVFRGIEDRYSSVISGEADGDIIKVGNYGYSQDLFTYIDGEFKGSKGPNRIFKRDVASHENTPIGVNYQYDETNNPFEQFSQIIKNNMKNFYIVHSAGIEMNCLKPNVLYTIQLMNGAPEENNKYAGKYYAIVGYRQRFTRDNEMQNKEMFVSSEEIFLVEPDVGQPS
jgi:hypothetical protein